MANSWPVNAGQGFYVELPKNLDAVEDGRLALMEYLEPLRLDARVLNRIEVVLEELLSNVVRHAQLATVLRLSASASPQGISLCVEDDGAAFNPLDADENAPFDKLENAALGGLGIPLIKRLTVSVEYERSGSANRISAIIAT